MYQLIATCGPVVCHIGASCLPHMGHIWARQRSHVGHTWATVAKNVWPTCGPIGGSHFNCHTWALCGPLVECLLGCHPPSFLCRLLLTSVSVKVLCTPVSPVCPRYSCYFSYPVVFAAIVVVARSLPVAYRCS